MVEASRTIQVDALARVEGEGALTIRLEGDRVLAAELRIFEPPRFFEAFLRGRSYQEAPDLTARICGICPVAYQTSAANAMEDALGIDLDPRVRLLRRLLYTGEWIESHTLHIFMLHLPDYLGFPDLIAMAKTHGDLVRRALRIKKAGNEIVRVLGGREIHPINPRVGGFHRAPEAAELAALVPELTWAREAMHEATIWLASLPTPELERDYELVALRADEGYPLEQGRIVSSQGIDAPVRDFDVHFVEEQVSYSNALQARVRARGAYLCGPLARIHLNFDRLSAAARRTADAAGFRPPCRNPFRTIIARGIEVVEALDVALDCIARYRRPSAPFAIRAPDVDRAGRAGTGHGASEAPRGLLYHRYRLDAEGLIEDAWIVPPTAQNQRSIEGDLVALGARLGALPLAAATALAEHAVRNHDPCISCATHFLRLAIERR